MLSKRIKMLTALSVSMLVTQTSFETGRVNAFIDWGPCEGRPMPIGWFDEPSFATGIWFEIMRSSGVWFQRAQECVSAVYEPEETWNSDVMLTYTYWDGNNEVHGNSSVPARFDMHGNGFTRPLHPLPIETSYTVLDTDYIQYAVIYGCDTWLWGLFHTQQAWVLSRAAEMSETMKSRAIERLREEVPWYNPYSMMHPVQQGEDCEYIAKELNEDQDVVDGLIEDLYAEDGEDEEIDTGADLGFGGGGEEAEDDDEDFWDEDAAEARRADALAQATAFLTRLQKLPEIFDNADDESSYTKNIKNYYEDLLLGGGSLFSAKYYGAGQKVEVPLADDYR